MPEIESPLVRLQAQMCSMAVSLAQCMGMHEGIDLRWIDNTWHCTKATPIVWFDSALFEVCARPSPMSPWLFEDSRIKLTAANGAWIWVTTDRREHKPRLDGEPATYYEARWPD